MTAFQDMRQIGECTLYLGDAREVLPTLGKCTDLVMTDWPYKLTSGGMQPFKEAHARGMFDPKNYDNKGQLFDTVEWAEFAPDLFAACRDDADAYIMSNDRELQDARAALEAAGFEFHRLLPWHKVSCTANRWYMQDCEFCLYMWKGNARTINNCGSKALVRAPRQNDSDHPTEKPISILTRWIANSRHPGSVVLDPFMGSGSSIVAAAKLGIPAIGIEKSERWFETAVGRVEGMVRNRDARLSTGRRTGNLDQGVLL